MRDQYFSLRHDTATTESYPNPYWAIITYHSFQEQDVTENQSTGPLLQSKQKEITLNSISVSRTLVGLECKACGPSVVQGGVSSLAVMMSSSMWSWVLRLALCLTAENT